MRDISLVGLGHLVLAVVLTVHVVLHKDRPVSAVLWIGILWALPYVGALLYLVFGIDRVARSVEERRTSRALIARSRALRPGLDEHVLRDPPREMGRRPDHMARHILRGTDPAVPGHRVLGGNRAELLVDGDAFYPALMDAIEEARETVHVQTFIFAADDTGRQLRERLIERASQGVVVRLLYDRFGSTRAHFSRFFEPARRAGVQVRSMSQADPLRGRLQVNLRNHRKVTVVDGRLGFVGGINVSDDNVTRGDGRSPIRDYHVRLEGPAVADLQLGFVEDWCFATREPAEQLLGPDAFPPPRPRGDALMQVVPGGPDETGDALASSFFAAIVAAEESVTIVTPYFLPDEPILRALRYAARRGVDVRVVVPERSNHWYAGFASRALYEPLLRAGVRIFERAPPFMHAKALVVDGVYAMMGSANLDYRSLHLNFETNVEIVDTGFVADLLEQVGREVDRSMEVPLAGFAARPLRVRLAENLCRLLEPIL